MLPYTLKYAPKSTKEVIGQDRAIAVVTNFITTFKKQKKKALLLYGPPGSGKTCTAYAAARESNAEILEVNASDFRDEKKLNSSIGRASQQQSLFARSKILLVDEIDGLFSTKDRGAVPTLVNLIKDSAFPLLLTANNPWDKKYSKLRSACEMVEFTQLSHQAVLSILRDICLKENINYEEKALASLSRRAGGDIRGALIDLQTLAHNDTFTFEQLELLGQRRQLDTMFNALLKIFKTTDAFIARTAFNDIDEDLEVIQQWIDENLPKEYTKPYDLYRAYEKLSKADVFRGRIMKRQHWHFLAIINVLLSAGIALSKDEKYTAFVRYSPTQRFLKVWRANQRYAQRKAIAEKIASKTHCSKKRALHQLPYIQPIFKNKITAAPLIRFFDLNKEEIAWLVK